MIKKRRLFTGTLLKYKAADIKMIYMEKTEKTSETPNSPKTCEQEPKKAKKKRKLRAVAGKRRKKINNEGLWALIIAGVLIVFSACISAAVITVNSNANKPTRELLVAVEPKAPIVIPSVIPVPEPAKPPSFVAAVPMTPPERPPARRGNLAFIIDDAGNNLWELEPFLNFPGSLTIAVLPGLPYSAEAARRIREAGMEVILHQPMEALGGQPPGPGAIYYGMSAEEIREILTRNVAEIAPVAGMNNHQGSRITLNKEIMETVLAFCKEHDLYFLDSRTVGGSIVPAVARRLGMTIGERDIFLDNDQCRAAILRSIYSGLAVARLRGSAVMIGHVWSPELASLLHELYPQLTERGYTFAPVSALILGETE